MTAGISNELTPRRKAAMIVQLLLNSGGTLALDQFPKNQQLTLTDELSQLGRVDQSTVAKVVQEFLSELENLGLAAPRDRDGAILALADHLSPELAEKLRQQLTSTRNADPWPAIVEQDIDLLRQIMLAESTEVCAIALSKLPVSKAAKVLEGTPGDRARQITLAMSNTKSVSPDTVKDIGKALVSDYISTTVPAFEKAPVQRLGAILNATPSLTRDDVLDSLDQADPDFATGVRKAIFTFKDIVNRVKPTDIPNAIKGIDGGDLARAIAGAQSFGESEQKSADFILANISQRMATQLREDADEMPNLKKSTAEAAMSTVTTAIRELIEGGIITLIDPDTTDADEENAVGA